MALAVLDSATYGRPQFAGYGFERNPRTRRLTAMDGAPRFRLTAPASTIIVNVSWVMDDQTLNRFRYWMANDISGGSLWFVMELMLGTGRSGSEPDSQTFRSYECHFLGEPRITPTGYNVWNVAATLELRNSAQYPIEPPDPSAQRFSDFSDGLNEHPAGGEILIYSTASAQFENRPFYQQAGGYLEAPAEITIPLALDIPAEHEVIDLAMIAGSGSGFASGLIGGTVIEGLDTVAFDTTERLFSATGANDMAVDDDLVFRVDQVTGAADLWFRFKLRRSNA